MASSYSEQTSLFTVTCMIFVSSCCTVVNAFQSDELTFMEHDEVHRSKVTVLKQRQRWLYCKKLEMKTNPSLLRAGSEKNPRKEAPQGQKPRK